MKALVVDNENQLVLKENLPLPVAGEGEILVQVKSASVNPFDAQSAAGNYDAYLNEYDTNEQVKTGLEFSGIVVQGGRRFGQGDKVFGYIHMIAGWKTHAEFIAINEDYLALLPQEISFPQGAAIPLGALTTLIAFTDIGQLHPGMSLLINGASGGLGLAGIQIGKILGAKVTAIAGPGQEAYLRDLGADTVYDRQQQELTGLDSHFDLILDLTNQLTFKQVKARLTPKGKFIPAEPNDDNGGNLASENIGYLMVFHGDHEKLTQIAAWLKEGKLRSVVDSEYAFTQHQQAFARLNVRGRRGRIILNW